MTTTGRDEVAKRRLADPRSPRTVSDFIATALLVRALELAPKATGITWPSPKYQQDPVGFFRDILGVELAPYQAEIAEAVASNKRVAVSSGHKIGKSLLMAGLALWFYCSFPDARAVMTSTTDRQVNKILWREMRKLLAFSGWCLACKKSDPDNYRRTIERPCPHSAIVDHLGSVPELARTGIHAADLREVSGFTAREAEAVAGISSANVFYLGDEASGIPDQIFTAMRGNMMGGGRILLCSNPTQTEGYFFEAFDKTKVNEATGKSTWKTFVISSEMVARLGLKVPGLASLDEVEEWKREYGEDSPFYKIRVKGEFALGESGKLISLKLITEAQTRWDDMPPTGRLHIGIDPAGEGGAGDESAFAARRGQKILSLYCRRGLTAEAHLVELLGILANERQRGDEPPVVTVDRDGLVGARVYARLVEYLETHEDAFVLVGVRSSVRRAHDKYRTGDTVRDELWINLREWLKAGGAIPQDAKLEKELHVPDTIQNQDPDNRNVVKVMPKTMMREKLGGRSPDRADAVCLSVWEKGMPAESSAETAAETSPSPAAFDDDVGLAPKDAYDALDVWQGR